MLKSLRVKFLIPLLAVSIIALSSAFILRELMIRDFKEYLEGELEDRIYWVMADLEEAFERNAVWKEDLLAQTAVRALMMGLETQVTDVNGVSLMDTEKAINRLSPLMKMKIMAMTDFIKAESEELSAFQPYPLFLNGKEIGTLEVRFLRENKESIFIERSNKFFLVSTLALGGLTIFMSIFFSRRLTKPINKLTAVAKAVSEGNFGSRVINSGHDEISRLSTTFNKMLDNLGIQESLRKKLISNVAHEIRTPVGAIRGELEGMIDGLIPTNKEQLQSLYEETGRLKNILEGIEDLAQAEASAMNLKRQTLELQPFLKNITERYLKLFLEKGIALELQCDDQLSIEADPDRLSQIVINLLSNAAKATKNMGKVSVMANRRGTEVALEIADDGCGIRPEVLPFIFERFYKASEGGLGLGLPIVKELVEAHGGRIEVRSEYGKGAVFTVFLPWYGHRI